MIHSDGKIVVREFDHHGPDGHYRIISRAEGTADIETVQELYDEVLKLIYRRKKPFPKGLDAEIVLEEPGLKISVDASITDGKNNGITLMNEFMDHVDLTSKQDLNT